MWKWIKGRFKKQRQTGFTGYAVALYRNGVPLARQHAPIDSVITYKPTYGPIIFENIMLHGYTLIPNLETLRGGDRCKQLQ